MPPDGRRVSDEAESAIRHALNANDVRAALHAAGTAYAQPLLDFLVHMLDSPADGEDVWAASWEKIATNLHTFRGESSFWTWAARIARNTAIDHGKAVARGPRLTSGMDKFASRDAVARRLGIVTRSTPEYLRSSFRTRFGDLLARLSDEERALLHLRYEHQLPWNDVARAIEPGDGILEGAALREASAKRRKQFERLKRRIQELASELGVIDPS